MLDEFTKESVTILLDELCVAQDVLTTAQRIYQCSQGYRVSIDAEALEQAHKSYDAKKAEVEKALFSMIEKGR